MSRISNDEIIDGKLENGFDYDLQVWVRHGRIQDCGHPQFMKCDCIGRAYTGEPIEVVRAVELGIDKVVA